ncbi:hypothetical protein PG994_007283 [Apiospora phragmitis]|uniref:MARVEL domain-containing protein n=1 Tax=Apiospora phragmitis TaxID=2905665 RepID=A0ABR1V0C8_9PEZI
MLARGLHALLAALAIGLITCYSVASNKVHLFTLEILFAIFSLVWFCLLFVSSFTSFLQHAPLPRVMVAAVSLLVDTLIFLRTASVLASIAFIYYQINQINGFEDAILSSSTSNKSGGKSGSSWHSTGGSSSSSLRDSSKPYMAAIVMTAIFDFFLLCDLVIAFLRMLSAAHEASTSVPVQKLPEGPANIPA